MKKLIKTLVLFNVLVLVAATLFYTYLQSDDPSNGFNGMVWGFPLLTSTGSAILLLAATFFTALKKTTYDRVQTTTQRHKNVGLSLLATSIPLLLLYFSIIGENRDSLKVIAVVGIIVCLLSAMFNLVRNPK